MQTQTLLMPGAELSGRREPEAPWGFLLSSGVKDLGFHKGIHRAIDAWGVGSAGDEVEHLPGAPLSCGRPGLFIRDEKKNVLSLKRNAWQGNGPWKPTKRLSGEPVWLGNRSESPTWASHTWAGQGHRSFGKRTAVLFFRLMTNVNRRRR